MNVFQIHADIVSNYSYYNRSFLKITDPGIRYVVKQAFDEGKLWLEARWQK